MVIGEDGAAHRKPVTLGIAGEDDVQIISGVAAGDMVITTGAYGLDEGTKVKVGPAAARCRRRGQGQGGRLMPNRRARRVSDCLLPTKSFWLARTTRTIFFFAAVLTRGRHLPRVQGAHLRFS